MKTPTVTSSFVNAKDIISSLNRDALRSDLNDTERAAIDFVKTDAVKLHDLNTKASYAYWNLLTLGGVQLDDKSNDFKEKLKALQQKHGDGFYTLLQFFESLFLFQ